jgi:hypothetical protein
MPLIYSISIRLLQLGMLLHRKTPKIQPTSSYDCAALYQHFPSVFRLSMETFPYSNHKEVGQFISVMHKTIQALAFFMLQSPSSDDLQAYCADWHYYATLRCPHIRLQALRFEELGAMIEVLSIQARTFDPHYADAEKSLLPLDSSEAMKKAPIFVYPMVLRILYAMLDEHHNALQYFSFVQYVSLVRSFGHEEKYSQGLPAHLVLDTSQQRRPVELQPDPTALEYHVVGERIPTHDFCSLLTGISEPTTCSVCMTEIERERVDEPAVVTKCGHSFHQECLDTWVNDSSMESSNTCPSCRAMLCKSRERAHGSAFVNEESSNES